MPDDIEQLIASLDGELTPIRDVALRHLARNGAIDPNSSAVLLDHRPKYAPEAYAICLYPGLTEQDLVRYEELLRTRAKIDLSIPPVYRSVLSKLGGASLFDAALFGVPRSMRNDPPLLDRSTRQPIDIGLSERNRSPYGADASMFYFGAGPHSRTENLGYFLNVDGAVETYLRGGKRMGKWPSLREFLAEELARLEPIYVDSEKYWEQFRAELEASEKSKRGKRSMATRKNK